MSRCSPIADDRHKRNYFDRGIRVCKRWHGNPANFLAWSIESGYREGLQIDRIDNNGNYSPENCRWVTSVQNNHNQRLLRSHNTSGYVGVSINQGRFMASICSVQVRQGKQITIGRFPTAWAACQARNAFIIKHNLPHKIQEEIKNESK